MATPSSQTESPKLLEIEKKGGSGRIYEVRSEAPPFCEAHSQKRMEFPPEVRQTWQKDEKQIQHAARS